MMNYFVIHRSYFLLHSEGNPVDELSGKQKAAVVLLSVDSETAAAVLKKFSDDELAAITKEMHALDGVEPRKITAVLHEFSINASQEKGITPNPSLLRERLELAVGRDGTRNIFRTIGLDDTAERAFQPLHELAPQDLHKVLAEEHPQTAAIVLSYLQPKHAAGTLAHFPEDAQVDVIRRMAGAQQADDAIVKRVGEIIRTKTGMMGERRKTQSDDPRYKKVAEVINLLGQEAEGRLLETLGEGSPEIAAKIREMMFVFEDLVIVSDADMRKVLMSVDSQILAMALKTASKQLKEKIFANLSRRAKEMVKEELELLGPKPLSQVKAAQQQIVDAVRELESSGEINLRGAKSEEDPLV